MKKGPASAEMHVGPGFRIRSDVTRPDRATIEAFAAFETPDISDLMNRMYTMRGGIRPMTDLDLRILGPACTVKTSPGDNLTVHKSLDIAKPGDVVVVDAGGSTLHAVLGDTITMKARHRGIAGFVIDGMIRDLPGILAIGDIPVFAKGVTPIGPLHRGPGEVNYPIGAGGVVVNPGDIIVGDANGVVVVEREVAEDVINRLRRRATELADYLAAVAAGRFSNEWVDQTLRSNGIDPMTDS